MPDQVQLRGGTEGENDGFTGVNREVTVDTTNKTLRVHDGVTAGGHPLIQGTASSAADADTIALRDAWGRLQVADPVNDSDVANKGWVEGAIAIMPLAELVVEGSPISTVTFDNISQEYRHLELQVMARGTNSNTTAELRMRFNNDSGANYDRQYPSAAGSTLAAGGITGATELPLGSLAAATAPAGAAGAISVSIPGYSSNNFHKGYTAETGIRRGTSAGDQLRMWTSGHWINTNPISRIDLFPHAGSFDVGSIFTLYGKKGA